MVKQVKTLKVLFFVVFGMVAVLLIGSNGGIPQGIRFLAVQSGSMEPTLHTGDLIISKPSPEGNYSPREVVVFKATNGSLVTHRLIEKIEKDNVTLYTTKGDANEVADSDQVTKENIIGEVKTSIPFLGRFVNFARSSLGFALLIVIPSFYIIIAEAISIRDEVAKGRRKEGIPPEVLSLFLILGSFSISAEQTYSIFTLSRESDSNVFAAGNSFSTIFESADYSCTEGALTQSTNFGSVFFTEIDQSVHFTVDLREASPSAEYDIAFQQEPGDCYRSTPNFPGGITTDISGNATESFSVDRVTGAEKLWVEISKEDQILRSAAVRLE